MIHWNICFSSVLMADVKVKIILFTVKDLLLLCSVDGRDLQTRY